MALTLGLAGVFMINGKLQFSEEVFVDLPKTESGGVTEIITKKTWKGFELIGQGWVERNLYGAEEWITYYETNDFRRVSKSFSEHNDLKKAKKELNERISEAAVVWSYTKKRVVLENQEDSAKWIDIILVQDEKTFKILTAESLELAIEFEKWLEAQSQN
jgi:hypothetical protein